MFTNKQKQERFHHASFLNRQPPIYQGNFQPTHKLYDTFNTNNTLQSRFIQRIEQTTQIDGWLECFDGNGSIKSTVRYINGLKHGDYEERFKSGSIKSKVNYINGKKQGVQKKFWQSGSIKSTVNYINDIKQGVQLHFYDNSQDYIQQIRKYIYEKREEWYEKCGQLDSDESRPPFEYYVEDYLIKNIQSSVNYINDMKQGPEKTYHKNHSIRSIVNYIDNNKQGLLQIFDENGNLQFEADYVNNIKQGFEEGFYNNGSVKTRVNYINGCRQGLFEKFYTVHKHSTKEIVNNVIIPKSMKFYVDNIQITECVICLDQLIIPYITTCGHIYCLSCFSKVPRQLDQNNLIFNPLVKCPLCYQMVCVQD